MQNPELDFPKSHFENLKTIRFFFENQSDAGFLFCVSNYLETNRFVNQTLVNDLKTIDKSIGGFDFKLESQAGFVAQCKETLNTFPDGLIVNNLDALITQTKGEVIQTLNFAREAMMDLGKPILFWLSEEHHTLFINLAIDLYSRRSYSTLYFKDLNLSQKHGMLENRFSELAMSSEDYTTKKVRLQLLEKQLKEAEESGYPKEKIAKELVFDLMNEYINLDFIEPLKNLINKYELFFKDNSFEERHTLGNAYKRVFNLEKASLVFQDLLSDAETMYGLYNPTTAVIQNEYAVVLNNFKNATSLEQAKGLFEKAIHSGLFNFGETSIQVAIRRSNLGEVFKDLAGQENLIQAKENLEKSLKTILLLFDQNSSQVAKVRSNLALVFLDLGGRKNLGIAKELLEKALDSNLNNFGEHAPDVATSRSNLALVFIDLGGKKNLLLAKEQLEKALTSELLNHEENSPLTALTQYNLGALFVILGKTADAFVLLKKAHATFLTIYGSEHKRSQACLSWLEQTKELIDKEGKA